MLPPSIWFSIFCAPRGQIRLKAVSPPSFVLFQVKIYVPDMHFSKFIIEGKNIADLPRIFPFRGTNSAGFPCIFQWGFRLQENLLCSPALPAAVFPFLFPFVFSLCFFPLLFPFAFSLCFYQAQSKSAQINPNQSKSIRCELLLRSSFVKQRASPAPGLLFRNRRLRRCWFFRCKTLCFCDRAPPSFLFRKARGLCIKNKYFK